MVTIWRTDQPHPNSAAVSEQVYNGLDSCVTLEVLQELLPQLNEVTQHVYDFERALMAPILEMQCRGVRVDQEKRKEVFSFYDAQRVILEAQFDRILTEGIGIPTINVGSWQQKQYLLYDVLGLPPVKSKGKITTDRKALEKLRGNFYAEPICNHILALQDVRKKLGFLKTGIDSDGRIRTSYNIGGTDTGRLSSYESCFGSGTNLQNVTGEMRSIFIADPGKKLAYIDLEQAESRAVGAIIWNTLADSTYLDFCESGDLHTAVCRMTWPDLPWTGGPNDKALAKRKFYRDFDYRDAAKRLGHASNYMGKPPHISKEVRIPLPLVTNFQRGYFTSFPGIPAWHSLTRQNLINKGYITTFMGRQRYFFGRRYDDETLRAAIAYEPQSAVADILNKGLLAVWKSDIECDLLLQVHDAIVIQYDEEKENEVVPAVQKLLEIEVPLMNGRSMTIPTEAEVGWNWGKQKDKSGKVVNVDGLVPFTGNDDRKRAKKVLVVD